MIFSLDDTDIDKSGTGNSRFIPHQKKPFATTSLKKELMGETSKTCCQSKDVVKKVIMTKTEIVTYPSGQTFYKSTTWEMGKPTTFKKKNKKKVKVKNVVKQKEEVY